MNNKIIFIIALSITDITQATGQSLQPEVTDVKSDSSVTITQKENESVIKNDERESISDKESAIKSRVDVDAIKQVEKGDSQLHKEAEETTANKKAQFDILEIRVKGNTLLSKKVLEKSVYSFLGYKKTLDDVEQARSTLEKSYKSAGYPAVVVSIPEQKINNGIVKIQVVEGKISRVRISGSQYHSLTNIKQKVPALSRGNVLYLPDVQQQLNNLNQSSPDRKITPVLRPGRSPGTVEVELKVQDTLPMHGEVEINNRNSSTTTKTRASASLRYDNLFQKQHSFGLQYQISPEKTEEVKVLALTYIMPVSSENDRLVIYGIDSNSKVSTLGDTTVLGNGKILGVRWVKPLTGTQSYFHSISPGFDYKDFEDTQEIDGTDTIFPISYWSTTFRYDASVISQQQLYQYNASIVFGVPINSRQNEFTSKRVNSKTNFLFFTGGVSHKYSFENKYEIRTRLDAQIATSPLISNEQFSAGGATSVRGYFESQLVNDTGITASLELVSPPLYESIKDINDFRLHLFYDGSKSWRKDPLPGEGDSSQISGAGVGFRLKALNDLSATMDVAWALKDQGEIKKNDVRLHFKLAYEF